MKLKFEAINTRIVEALRNGGLDANGQVPERTISDGDGNPCRHCQKDIEKGKEMLVLSHKPFATLQPYAEQGPIFLCAEDCPKYEAEDGLPETVLTRPEFLLRGYDGEERIVGGTGKVVPTNTVENYAAMLLEDLNIAEVHVRSSSNNCYFGKIKRAE